MLKKGASNKEISEEFNIGISTVKSHVSSILSKMNAKSRKELMRL
jgi:DNA-binding NarL/FixJ family response regulator